MTASPEGCGVIDHIETCLCDVIIDKPVPIMQNFHLDYWGIRTAMDVGDYSIPFDAPKFADLMHKMCVASDILAERERMLQDAETVRMGAPQLSMHGNAKMSFEARQYVKNCVDNKMNYSDIIHGVEKRFGVSISKSYISKKRYIFKGIL
jgi:hypothetical protein